MVPERRCVLVVGIIGCVALIVLVVVAVLILRRKQLLCHTSVSREDSNEHGNTENTDPTLFKYEDLRYRPGNDTLYSHLDIDNSTENTDPTLSQHEDLRYRPGNDTLYSNLGKDNKTGEENDSRPQYDNVQEIAVIETNTSVMEYENLEL